MAKLTDLPTEILQKIVRSLDTLYEHETDLTVFNIARVNRRLMGIAIDVHFNLVRPSVQPTSDPYQVESSRKWDDEKWKEMFIKMLKHERCYRNYKKARSEVIKGRGVLSHGACTHYDGKVKADRVFKRKKKPLRKRRSKRVALASSMPIPYYIYGIMESD